MFPPPYLTHALVIVLFSVGFAWYADASWKETVAVGVFFTLAVIFGDKAEAKEKATAKEKAAAPAEADGNPR